MKIGMGIPIPDLSNLPGSSRPGGGGTPPGPLVLSYSSSAFCANASDPTPTVTGNVGAGTYSSTAGLVFADSGTNTNSSTGVVDISASTTSATPYVITYTDTNSATATFNLTLNALDDAAFSYSASSFAQNFPDPTPTITGLAGGTFSGTTGLVINSTTGEIDLSASTISSHTITYDTTSSGSSVCPNTSNQTVNIVAELAQVNNVYSMEFDGASSQYIEATNSALNNANAITFSGWFKKTSGNVVGFESFVSTTDRIILYWWSDNNVYWSVRNGSESSAASSALTIYDWNHIVGTFDGTTNTIKLYINGSLVDTQTGQPSSTSANLSDNFHIGLSDGSTYNNGQIDEVSIFNTALTELEVKKIYYATEVVSGVIKTADLNDLTTPPVKWYRMGD